MKVLVSSLLSGIVFGAGLVVSGMTRPDKVVGFLDILGDWDPSLGFVMAGALLVHAPLRAKIIQRGGPLCAETFGRPSRQDIDKRLIGGAVLFGLGWGLAGYCPGPALVSALPAGSTALLFVAAMLGGMGAVQAWDRFQAGGKQRASALPGGR